MNCGVKFRLGCRGSRRRSAVQGPDRCPHVESSRREARCLWVLMDIVQRRVREFRVRDPCAGSTLPETQKHKVPEEARRWSRRDGPEGISGSRGAHPAQVDIGSKTLSELFLDLPVRGRHCSSSLLLAPLHGAVA